MSSTAHSLYTSLWDILQSQRGHFALSDFQETVLAAVALKAADERSRYRDQLTPHHLLPTDASKPWTGAPTGAAAGWQHLGSLSATDLASALLSRRSEVEKREPSLEGALSGLDAATRSAHERPVRALVERLARTSLDPTSFDVPWALAAALERLLLRLAEVERGRGEFATGPGLARLAAKLLELKSGQSVHDPAAGTARMLVECARCVAEAGGDPRSLRYSGHELVSSVWSAGRILMWACGLDASQLTHADSLLTSSGRPVDRLICHPPFGRKVIHQPVPGVERHRRPVEDLFLERAIASLSPQGRAVLVMPKRFLFDRQSSQLRRSLVDRGMLRAVVQLPSGVLFGTSMAPTLVVLDTAATDKVILVDSTSANWDGETGELADADIAEIHRLVSGRHSTNMPNRRLSNADVAECGYALGPDGLLSGSTGIALNLAWRSRRTAEEPDTPIVLSEQQETAFHQLKAACEDGGLISLVGSRGFGKSLLLSRLQDSLVDASVARLDLCDLDSNELVSQVEPIVHASCDSTEAFTLMLDDWEEADRLLPEQQTAAFQRLLHGVLSREGTGSVLLTSESSLGLLQSAWGREILPRQLLGSTRTVRLKASVSSEAQEASLQQLREAAAAFAASRKPTGPDDHVEPIDLTELLVDAGIPTDALTFAKSASQWESFLRELSARAPWVATECRIQGFDFGSDRGLFGDFLRSLALRPSQFIAGLLRPTDLRTLFPATEFTGDKEASLRAAFEAWSSAREES